MKWTGACVMISILLATGASGPPRAEPEPRKNEDLVQSVSDSNNHFGFALYDEVRKRRPGENLFLSPTSLSTALAMTYTGARGATAEEMAKTLRWTVSGEELHAAMGSLARSVTRDDPTATVTLANALWGLRGLSFEAEFLDRTRQHYGAGFREVDFRSSPEPSRQTINAWVEDQTRDRIRDLLLPGDVTSDTTLVLTNAIWFKGTWKRRFDPSRTRKARFHRQDAPAVDVDMMSMGEARLRYFEDGRIQALELPYAGEQVSMVILLPAAETALAELENRLDGNLFGDLLTRMESTQLTTIEIPRFEMTTRFELARTLRAMGMRLAFSGEADFSGITAERRLAIDEVIHKAFVRLDEEGTEAAAATGVVMKRTSMPAPRVFRADRPFLFVIVDRHTRAVLFLGRLVDP